MLCAESCAGMGISMENYSLKDDMFIIREYDKMPPFSSFLPGLAGIRGIPMWVFYTNRGQGINSFGIHHKGNAIMEFNPANTAYENTSLKGFRTFIKKDGAFFEAFAGNPTDSERTLFIRKNSFALEEVNSAQQLTVHVNYFVLPTEALGALVRKVTVTNTGSKEVSLELVDGIPKIIPYGIQNGAFKEMSNLLKSWTEIKNLEKGIPYYTMRASSDDSAEVSEIEGGYFYAGTCNGKLLPVLYDAEALFGYDTSLLTPVEFINKESSRLTDKQCFANKVPCGFSVCQRTLNAGESVTLTSYIGFAGSLELLNSKQEDFLRPEYADKKEAEADQLIEDFMKDVKTHTANPVFDQYVEQCYLDNFLRGGYPYVFSNGENKAVVHLFSRKHGDPERDYNFFSIAGEYYSQGNGNFRDVCQNRRNDVFFQKDIGDFNVRSFYELIQIDGYNPLEIRPSTFHLKSENQDKGWKLLNKAAKDKAEELQKIVKAGFTPGQISNTVANRGISLTMKEDLLLEELLGLCEQRMEAGFGEGYWSDHWDYNLDLIENYLSVYPERQYELLNGTENLKFYDSGMKVLPMSKTCVLSNGKVRQYGALLHDKEKQAMEGFTPGGTNWLKNADGSVATTSLFGKMLTLAANKFALLDPYGMGISMDGGKPGWNDAMNGLPGLFGSGMAETCELKRLVKFLKNSCETLKDFAVRLPEEVSWYLKQLQELSIQAKETQQAEIKYWEAVTAVKEEFREKTRMCLSGKTVTLSNIIVSEILQAFEYKLTKACEKAMELGNGIMPTYFTYEAVRYEKQFDEYGRERVNENGLPLVKILEFKQNQLPAFLEGPARAMTLLPKETAKQMHLQLQKSDLYDSTLKMYKTSGSLEQISMENGRIRAFTPGWLERESIFLHMEYKYFLSLLRAGFYEEFYEAIKDALIPFLPAKRYGRSILENSSFLASSVNPDPNVHGRGFVARLSGSTIELLSMWIEMFMGSGGFFQGNKELGFRLDPKLPSWLFDEEGMASFTLLSSCQVIYYNPEKKATYGSNGVKIRRFTYLWKEIEYEQEGNCLEGAAAEALRAGEIKQIKAYLATE